MQAVHALLRVKRGFPEAPFDAKAGIIDEKRKLGVASDAIGRASFCANTMPMPLDAPVITATGLAKRVSFQRRDTLILNEPF